jgi:hypothetical protein
LVPCQNGTIGTFGIAFRAGATPKFGAYLDKRYHNEVFLVFHNKIVHNILLAEQYVYLASSHRF